MNEFTKYIQEIAKSLPADRIISPDRVQDLLRCGPVDLTIDGNCACALLGKNLQEGEAEFVEIGKEPSDAGYNTAVRKATVRALRRLTARCYPDGNASLPYNLSRHTVMGCD